MTPQGSFFWKEVPKYPALLAGEGLLRTQDFENSESWTNPNRLVTFSGLFDFRNFPEVFHGLSILGKGVTPRNFRLYPFVGNIQYPPARPSPKPVSPFQSICLAMEV